MKWLNINCNGPDTIQDTIEIDDNIYAELLRAKKENRKPVFSLVDEDNNFTTL